MWKKAESHGIQRQCCYREAICHSVIASCCEHRLHFSGADCLYAIYSLRIHYYNTRNSWEGRRKNRSQSDFNNYLDYLKSLSLFYIRKTSPLQLYSLCILYGFLILFLRQNVLLHILILSLGKQLLKMWNTASKHLQM